MYISFAAGGERGSETQRGSRSARAAREARIPPEEIRRVRVHATNRSLVDSLRETPLADFSGGELRERIRSWRTRTRTRTRREKGEGRRRRRRRERMEDKGERRRNGRGVKKERSGSASWNKGSS